MSGRICFGIVVSAAFLLTMVGCRTISSLPAVNLREPDWKLRQGQAVWQSQRDAPEIAGEVLLATNPDGRTMLQFTKNPLPFVSVQTSNEFWQIEFVPEKRSFAGKGTPTPRLIWIHLARALDGVKPREPLHFEFTDQRSWKIENRDTGEAISGFLNP